MKMLSRRSFAALAQATGAAFLLPSATRGAMAQDRWPERVVRLVVPYPPGGSTDLVARQYADRLTSELGQTVLVDNRPGGGTNIGAGVVANAPPDGYTLLFANNSQVLNPIFGPEPPFELGALEPISVVSRLAFVLCANPDVPFKNARDMLAAAKAAPGKFTVASAQLDLYIALLAREANINLLHVPYKGGAPAVTDAISGQVNMVFALVPVLQSHIRAGKLRPLAVTVGKRLDSMPDVPTLKELGVQYDIAAWYGLMAPAGTPKPVIDRLGAATHKVMGTPDMIEKIKAAGAEPSTSTPAQFQAELRRETAFWQKVAQEMPHLVKKS